MANLLEKKDGNQVSQIQREKNFPNFVKFESKSYTIPLIMFILGVLFVLIQGNVLNVIVTLPFVMTYFLMADDLDMGGIQALKASAAMMKGHKWRYLRMQISFIPLLFLSVFTLYIALLWIVPYLQMTVTMFYRDLLGELDQDIYGDYREDQDIYGHYSENEFAGDQDDFNSEA